MKIPTITISDKLIEKINKTTSYLLVIFLWAPHGARECVQICNGPYFISPMIGTFLMPNWTMDMSLRGWLIQVLFAPPLMVLLYVLHTLEKKKYFSLLRLYGLRWTIMWFGILAYYNLVFWSSLRDILLPIFSFITS
jgi:hypothetical protein